MTGPAARRRIAILGGGAGSMAAAWALTSLPAAAERFDITVYQMGWRLGGKGASGRNASFHDRIEEHGLHVWAGFYANAFKMMRDLYGALPNDGRPLQNWDDAFKRHSAVMVEEWIDDQWVQWAINLPENDEEPGIGGELPTPLGYLELLLDFLAEWARGSRLNLGHTEPPPSHLPGAHVLDTLAKWDRQLLAGAVSVLESVGLLIEHRIQADAAHARDLLITAKHVAQAAPLAPGDTKAAHHAVLVSLIRDAHASAHARLEPQRDSNPDVRRFLDLLSLGAATAIGIVEDGVLEHGFEVINDEEWSSWLRRHGATEAAVTSALARGIYDYVFGYAKGEEDQLALEAGTATNGIMRLFFTYKGSLFWEMQAGMGDVVFAPAYEVLKARGVRFEFFTRVEALERGADTTRVDRIVLRRQAEVRDGRAYEPLRNVRGVPSWPSQPDLAQLVDGERYAGINFESAWAPPTGTTFELHAGRDFDDVILGISLGGLATIAGNLAAPGTPFADMLQNVKTVQTCSMQLWLSPDAAGIGAPQPARIVSAYAQYLNTWSDMTFLLPRETWPEDGPRFLAYFCGQFPDAPVIPPFDDHDFPAREQERFKSEVVRWLTANAKGIWPGAVTAGGEFDWQLLWDEGQASGAGRLASQYLRINIDPTERYVLSVPGSSRFRLRGGQSGFTNLFLAGDWVRTSINAGCVEAAVMAGMDAAAALSGDPIHIVGGLG
jgi:uncharacterized protein with NAD-binding domain and iron-sulfur cluster